ncbi:helix-turn-helix domain-containing protein [Bacillus sp. FJAT-22090]|uniref:helix-turn-helix domain-containing protein n=1 Tax=Bacillus sp. FJAT-22090 TaxID=1581038 RepID=UPI0011A415EC|nr:helix-turn-helix transcriptional regulator [Bacillus sp. FJAT-22090]
MSVFAKRLKQCREDKKNVNPVFTQEHVANKIGVARTTYTAYENGTKMPPLDTVNIIADFFDVSTDYLLGRIDTPNIDSTPTLNTWLRQENADLSESERDELGSEIEDYLAVRKQRILEKRNGK